MFFNIERSEFPVRESENREDENPGIKMKSLQKALEVLNCFIEKQPLGVTEIGGMLGLYKSNVHNSLKIITH